jgi:hypothetical protein
MPGFARFLMKFWFPTESQDDGQVGLGKSACIYIFVQRVQVLGAFSESFGFLSRNFLLKRKAPDPNPLL